LDELIKYFCFFLRKETNKNVEEQELRDEIEDAFQEIKSLKLEEYEKALSEFNIKYNKWKFQRNKKVC
jgi:arginyl-tRNA synthetase